METSSNRIRYSIIIPTYQHLQDCLIPCVNSIITHTDLSNVEVIIVANGCGDDGTKEFVDGLGSPFKLLWFDDGLGYAKATNEGMKIAEGEYLILLNNDTVLQDWQSKNDWIKILVEPFLNDDTIGITGPMKTYSESAGAEFLIFFCVMISRKLIDAIGYLDESYWSYGEDTDYAIRAIKSGFKIKQVPKESNEYYADKRMVAQFPIFHEGNVTHKNWPGGEEIIKRNNNILSERYNKNNNINIEHALKCDGFMSEQELLWLGKMSKQNKICCEVGSWHGRSSRSILDNLTEGGKLFCIDTWNGSIGEQDTNHSSARNMNGDAAFFEFMQNNMDGVQSGGVIPLRISGENASKLFKEKNIKFDFCFIDAGHTFDEVKKDIECWLPLVKDGGIICGHDYYPDNSVWEGVKRAVDSFFPNVEYIPNTSIWCHKVTKQDFKSSIYDAFPFNNELDLLEKRFSELFNVVDRFVLVESTLTHGGKPKPLYFKDNLHRFEKYLSKVSHVVVGDHEFTARDSWSIERQQRDCIMRALNDCKEYDTIIISDLDEIPNPGAVKEYKIEDGIKSFEMNLFYYNEHVKAKDKWTEAKILPYSLLKQLTPCGARYTKAPVIPNGGNHFSYFGGVESIRKKIEDTAHQELNTDEFKDLARIEKAVAEGTDLYGRDLQFEKV